VLKAARRQLREFEQRASINPLQPDLFATALSIPTAARSATPRTASYERRELPRMLDDIAAEHAAVHRPRRRLQGANGPCSDALFGDRRRSFDASPCR
jgi:hypothetical protein